jgi:hypothetical protein
MTQHGSPEHFRQVVSAHTVGPWGRRRCGVNVGTSGAEYRSHIERVWRPYELPADFAAERES